MGELEKQETVNGFEVLLVDVSNELVAIPISAVNEVIEYSKITSVPMCFKEVSGVINVRGSVVPVVDAAIRLRMETEYQYDKFSCIILYESMDEKLQENIMIGLVVSRVRSIQTISNAQIMDKPAFGVHIPEQYVTNMIEVDQETIPLLAMEALLDGRQINQGMLAHQRAALMQWKA
ncbi:hypothetical protein EJ063_07210 [Vibrio aquaticus]|uniref:Chemotaxis protein CheW n=1 Tax=Vibrio aquaticus TaxID=2496559 RepID=A0A3S0N678_9VIBR|nr:chemotaxis protein CheW [Vibrio aquaticus]RTZ16579.1 hypothetical protein EJ063_07210 [Vibrio aquaticus]